MWQVGRRPAVPVKNHLVRYARDSDSAVYMASKTRPDTLGSLERAAMMPRWLNVLYPFLSSNADDGRQIPRRQVRYGYSALRRD